MSSTELRVVSPPGAAGLVDIRVENLERDGSAVPGEYVTSAGAFRYGRPDLSVKGSEGVLALVTRCLRRLLVERFLGNTSITVHTDFDETPEDRAGHVELAELPALLVTGPRCIDDRRRSRNKRKRVVDEGGVVRELPTTRTVVAEYTLTVLSDSTRELLTLQNELILFIERTNWLEVPSDLPAGFAKLELRFSPPGTASVALAPSDSNLRQFTATVQVLGVDIDEDGLPTVGISVPITGSYTPPGATATSPGAGVVFLPTRQIPQ